MLLTNLLKISDTVSKIMIALTIGNFVPHILVSTELGPIAAWVGLHFLLNSVSFCNSSQCIFSKLGPIPTISVENSSFSQTSSISSSCFAALSSYWSSRIATFLKSKPFLCHTWYSVGLTINIIGNVPSCCVSFFSITLIFGLLLIDKSGSVFVDCRSWPIRPILLSSCFRTICVGQALP